MRSKWERKKRRYVYRAKTSDDVSFILDRIRLPSGKEFNYVHVDCPYEVAFIVGLDDNQRVLMLHQYRYLADQELLEIPAGSPHPGESLEEGAYREFEEESGYKAGSLVKIGSFFPSIGLTNQIGHIYLARNLQKSVQNLEEGESIWVEWISLEEAIELVRQGKVMNGGAAYGLLLTRLWIRHEAW